MAYACSRRAFVASAAGALSLLAVGCASAPSRGSSPADPPAPGAPSRPRARIASLKGPTSIGLVPFMARASAGGLAADYDFLMTTAIDEVVSGVVKGDVDIALLPANVASVLYAKTRGAVVALDVNALGVLHLVTGDADVRRFGDLAGRAVYLTGKGATPEYVVRHLLELSGIASSVSLEFKSEPAEVASVLAADPSAAGVLPQPFATAAVSRTPALAAPIALADVWSEVAGADGSRLVAGVTIARRAFAEGHPDVIDEFLAAHAESASAVTADPAAWAQGVVDAGIVDDPAIAEAAIHGCGVVCLTGTDLESALSGYLAVLASADPASVGGSLPDSDFYLA